MRKIISVMAILSILEACTPARLAVKGTTAVVSGAATAVSTAADIVL